MISLLCPRLTPFVFGLAMLNGLLACAAETDQDISIFGLSLSLISVVFQGGREWANV